MIRLTVARIHLGLLAALALVLVPALAGTGERVVTLGGSVTEIAVALGAEDRIVARDTTSNFPERIRDLPDVGYIRALSPENILALDPGLIVAEGDAGPPEAVEVLKELLGIGKTMAAKNAAKASYLANLSEAERLILPLVLHQRDQALRKSLLDNNESAKTEQHSRGC